ncbi:MAG: AMP-binding protein [Actinobacteria bacterium]|nr:AMP-binding protein [Actinomycetota bacterium]
MARPLADDDVYLFPFPLFHVAAYNVIHAHLRGRPVVLVARFDAAEVAALIERHRVTNISLAPTMIAMLLDHPAARRHDLSSLRVVAYGASAIPLPLLRRGLDELGCGFAQGYGMTELSGNAVFLTPDDHRRAAADRPDLLTAAGRPGPLAAIRLADDGEIEVRADQVIPGYWNRPDATADAFTADGWFRTGDIGRIDAEGYLSIVDRAKDIIVTGGENVASREVEDALAEHPDVAAVAVVGVAHPRWGEQVVAVATAADGATIDADAVLEWARGRLAGFKRPKALLVRDALPVNASGKVPAAPRGRPTGWSRAAGVEVNRACAAVNRESAPRPPTWSPSPLRTPRPAPRARRPPPAPGRPAPRRRARFPARRRWPSPFAPAGFAPSPGGGAFGGALLAPLGPPRPAEPLWVGCRRCSPQPQRGNDGASAGRAHRR